MKKVFLLALITVSVLSATAQRWSGEEFVIKKNMWLRGQRIDSVKKDTNNLAGNHSSLMTPGAVYDFVKGRVKNPGYSNNHLLKKVMYDRYTDSLKYAAQLVSIATADKALASTNWKLSATPSNRIWTSLFYSPEQDLFVSGCHNGSNPAIMISRDRGITWKTVTTPNVYVRGIAFSPILNLWATCGNNGNVITSSDGETWTQQTTPNAWLYRDIVWVDELGLFVAVANTTGQTTKVITSSDGITWTARTCPDRAWSDIVWSPELKLLVVSATAGINGDKIMTSPDGINWTLRSTPATTQTYPGAASFEGLTWSGDLGLFVASGYAAPFTTGTAKDSLAMTSPDGINWTLRKTPKDNHWLSVAWSPEYGQFVAVTDDSTNNIMTSNNGMDWKLGGQIGSTIRDWRRIYWINDLHAFATIAYYDGSGGIDSLFALSQPIDVNKQYALSDSLRTRIIGVYRKPGTDSIFNVLYNKSMTFAYKDSIGAGGGGGSPVWGAITGSLNSQTDLRDSIRTRIIGVYRKPGTDSIFNVLYNQAMTFAYRDSVGAGGGGGTPAGSNTYIQYNDGGAFGGDANFLWDKTAKKQTIKAAGLATGLLLEATGTDAYSPVLEFKEKTFNKSAKMWAGYNGDLIINATNGSYVKVGLDQTNFLVSFNAYYYSSNTAPNNYTMKVRGAANNTSIPIMVEGSASQSGNLIQWQNSAGTVLGYVNALGQLSARVLPRVGSTASSSTVTPDADGNDGYKITALAVNATIAAPSGTPTDGQMIWIRIKDNGTSRTLTWNAAYRAGTTLALPTATTAGKWMYCQFSYNANDSKYDFIGLTDGI